MTSWQMFVIAFLGGVPAVLTIIVAQWNQSRLHREEQAAKADLAAKALEREVKRDDVIAAIKSDVNGTLITKIEGQRVQAVADMREAAKEMLGDFRLELAAERAARRRDTPTHTRNPEKETGP